MGEKRTWERGGDGEHGSEEEMENMGERRR